MLYLTMDDILGHDERSLADSLNESEGHLQLSVSVSDLFQAQSRTELAQHWLKIWYFAERLAEFASTATCRYKEGDRGSGEFDFEFAIIDIPLFAARLTELATSFDPDDLEAMAFIYDEAEEWLSKRGDSPAWFPILEQNFRADSAEAQEYEGYEAEEDTE